MREFAKSRVPAIAACALAFLMGMAVKSSACQICVPYPKRSAADDLIDSAVVVLAREDPRKPFTFEIVEALKGEDDGSKIDLLVDRTTRRRLELYPEDAVVLAKRDEKSDWKRLGLADAAFDPVAREILRLAPTWNEQPMLRINYFSDLLGHADAQIRAVAHLEIGSAPYKEIMSLKHPLSREEIYAFLKNFRYAEWHSLYILLLGQSDVAEDRQYIAKRFHNAAAFSTTIQLAALTTAFIEKEKSKAVAAIEKLYFEGERRTEAELKEIVKALSVHGTNGHVDLRGEIVAAYATLIAHHPAMTPMVANDLIAWNRSELATEVADFEKKNRRVLDLQTSMRLRMYSRSASSQTQ